jgi:hypothetical protein
MTVVSEKDSANLRPAGAFAIKKSESGVAVRWTSEPYREKKRARRSGPFEV